MLIMPPKLMTASKAKHQHDGFCESLRAFLSLENGGAWMDGWMKGGIELK